MTMTIEQSFPRRFTGAVYGFLRVTNLLFRLAHCRARLVRVQLAIAVLLLTFAGVT